MRRRWRPGRRCGCWISWYFLLLDSGLDTRLHWRKRFGAGKGATELKIIFGVSWAGGAGSLRLEGEFGPHAPASPASSNRGRRRVLQYFSWLQVALFAGWLRLN